MSNNGEPVVLNDRYELQQRIGRGGMADVFLARDQLLNRQVAIKVLFPEFATDPNFVERFRREAQAAANLNHPNIVSVYDWGKYSNTYFMAMEYVQGRTLADILKANGHINSVQAAEIASEISAALGHAHANGVAHRDIKPANILIGTNGQVKVADFGIARAMNAPTENNLTQVGNVMGTATYFSPEQAQGAQPDPRSDLYSLGIVLYEMVAGRPPFNGDNPVSIAYKQVHDLPQPLNQIVADVPRSYEAIVAKLLSKQPDLRYPNADALRDDLRRFRNGEPVHALASMPGAKTPPPAMSLPNATTVLPQTTAMPSQGHYQAVSGGAAPRTTQMPPTRHAPMQMVDDHNDNRGSWYAIAGFVALLALVVGGLVLFNVLKKKEEPVVPQTATVPNVVGMLLEDAQKSISENNLTFTIEEDPNATEVEEGHVSATDPPSGFVLNANDPVKLIYRPLSQPVPIPDVTGMTVEEATAALAAEGFVLGTTSVEINPDFEEGTVIRTDPPSGELFKQGTIVNIVVSGGEEQVAIPTLTGMAKDAAIALLEAEPYLFVVTLEEQPSATVPEGSVIGSTPAEGQLVDTKSEVKLIISTGPAQVVVPELGNLTEAAARNLIEQNNLQVEVEYVPVAAGSPQDGKVISQNVTAGTEVDPDTVIKIRVGVGLAPPTTSTSTTTTSTSTTTTSTTTTTTVPGP